MDYNIEINSKNGFIFTLVTQLFMFGVLLFSSINVNIPLLRQCIGFVYLTFLPGFFILKILRVKGLSLVEKVLYSVGLSISFLMFLGLIMNTLYPILGIQKPLSPLLLMVTILLTVFVLYLLAYIRNRNLSCSYSIKVSNSTLLLLTLPFLAIFGAYLVNLYNINMLLFILIIIISVIPLFVTFFNWPKKEVYPLLIFVLSFCLLFHWSLISMHLVGSDIHYEYYFANLIIMDHHWIPTISNNLNAMLSVVILAPIYSNILHMDLTWVFKVVYPLIYALIPVGLYKVFQNQVNKKIAFLAVFYFISITPFFAEMTQLARQEIAELFFVLLMLLMLDKHIDRFKKSVLFILFGFSLVVSHYGLSYIYILLLVMVFVILWILPKFTNRLKNSRHNTIKPNISLTFMLLFSVFAISWYMYVSSSNALNTIVHIGSNMVTTILEDFLTSQNVQGLSMLTYKYSILHNITKYFYIISQLFIVVGIFKLSSKLKFTEDYKAFSIASVVLLVFCLTMPYFASSLNTTRLYHISLFFLAPFCVIGFIYIFKLINHIFKQEVISTKTILRLFSIFLMVFLLFNSGLIYEIGNDEPSSIALHSVNDKNFDFPYYNTKEIKSAIWVVNNIKNESLYTDNYGKYILNEFLPINNVKTFNDHFNSHENSLLYLRQNNVNNNCVKLIKKDNTISNTEKVSLSKYTFYFNKVYSNGGSDVYEHN